MRAHCASVSRETTGTVETAGGPDGLAVDVGVTVADGGGSGVTLGALALAVAAAAGGGDGAAPVPEEQLASAAASASTIAGTVDRVRTRTVCTRRAADPVSR
jgi:hypothetical protein